MAYIIYMSATEQEHEQQEALPKLNPSANMPGAQGSNIPLGWKPTPSEPVPVVRCTQIKKDGVRCGRWSLRGGTKCYKHGGNGGALKNVQAHREAIIEAAALRLLDDADMAIDTLEQLMEPGSSEAIRLKASTEVLDRVGIRGGYEVKVEADITEDSADIIRKRIDELAKGAAAAERLRARATAGTDDDDIVDAEVVDDEQPALFDLPTQSQPSDNDSE